LKLKHAVRVDASGPEVDPRKTPRQLSSRLQFQRPGESDPITLHWSHGKPAILKEKGIDLKGANNVFMGTKGILACGFSSRKLYPQNNFQDFKEPAPSIPDSPGFYKEWVDAAKGGPAATCHFDYSGPMTEAVLLANTAYRAGGGFEWDAQTLQAKGNMKAQALIREAYRPGWEV
jgi:hypothetical protein